MPGQPGGPGGPGSTGGGGGPPGGGPGGPMNRRMNAIKHANPLKDREAPTNRIGECHLTIFLPLHQRQTWQIYVFFTRHLRLDGKFFLLYIFFH